MQLNVVAILRRLKDALAEATQAGVLDQLACEYLDPNGVNQFCDAVNTMLRDQKEGGA